MRLLTFSIKTELKIGIVVEFDGTQKILDLSKAYPAPFPDLKYLLNVWEGHKIQIEKLVSHPEATSLYDFDEITWEPVITNPEKIICVGLNYRDHATETKAKVPEFPVIFSKYNNVLTGHLQPIRLGVSHEVDYEAELAVIIGKTAKSISAGDAYDHIAGYSIFHDVSARDIQFKTSQWIMGKTGDTHGPLGPWMVTKDEVSDPHNLTISLKIGDELLQNSNTRELIFSIPVLIAELSRVMTLQPGDVIATGTPAGVGFTRIPPRFLSQGDICTITIEGIGELSNPVTA